MNDLIDAFARLVSILAAFCGVAGVAYFLWGAYQYMSSAGSPQQADKAKTAMLHALVGVGLVLLAFTIVNVVVSNVGGTRAAIQIRQVTSIDAARLEPPRLVSLKWASPTIIIATFSEPVVTNVVGGSSSANIQLITRKGRVLDYNKITATKTGIYFVVPGQSGGTRPKLTAPFTVERMQFRAGGKIRDSDGNPAIYNFQPITFEGPPGQEIAVE